ncbi:MAG: PD-(D/E)XK nuclease family protein, partial [Chitinophagaceae bacterium]
MIAEFLKIDGTHGFKEKFLKAFLKILVDEEIIDNNFKFSCANVKVQTEYVTQSGRIDILITNAEKQAIIIENKIYAGDQFKQLKRYFKHGEKEFKENFILLYLTLFGSEASEQSSQGIDYQQISYENTIIQSLEKCVEIAARNAIVRETLIQYINYLKKLT